MPSPHTGPKEGIIARPPPAALHNEGLWKWPDWLSLSVPAQEYLCDVISGAGSQRRRGKRDMHMSAQERERWHPGCQGSQRGTQAHFVGTTSHAGTAINCVERLWEAKTLERGGGQTL